MLLALFTYKSICPMSLISNYIYRAAKGKNWAILYNYAIQTTKPEQGFNIFPQVQKQEGLSSFAPKQCKKNNP